MNYQVQPITDGLLTPEEPMIFLPFGVSIMSFRAMRWQYLIRQMRDIRLLISWVEEDMEEHIVYPFIKDPEVLYELHDLCLWAICTDYEGMLDVKRCKYYKWPDSWCGGEQVPHQKFCHVHPMKYCSVKEFHNPRGEWQTEARDNHDPVFHHTMYKVPKEWKKASFDWSRHQKLGSALNIYRPRLSPVLDGIYAEQKDFKQVIKSTVLDYPVSYYDYCEWKGLRFCSPV